MMKRVAITGMGIVNPLGNSVPQVLESLQAGRSGVELVPEYQEMGFRSSLAGTIKNFVPPEIDRIYLRQMGKNSVLSAAATLEAIADAGLETADIKTPRTGIIVGNSGTYQETYQLIHEKHVQKRKLTSFALPRAMASTVSANLSVFLGTQGHCMTVSSACSGGASAICMSAQVIRLGLQDRIITGAVHFGSWEFDCLFDALRVFSRREDHPAGASRPFHKDRDGLVPATAAGILILEDYEVAKARGAKIHAELIGFATNSDGDAMTTPSGEGSVRCMKLAIDDAGISAGEVDYVNAHATGTKLGDAVEAQGIAEVFGDRPYVSATKSMTGHEVSAAGATELIYTALMMKHGFIAPTINLDEIDPDCQCVRHVPQQAISSKPHIAVSNSFGFGGVNAVIALKQPE